MVVPYVHLSSLEMLHADIRMEIIELTTLGITVLRQAYNPQGFNIGINIGEAAGAGITEHVHMHVVPRWVGDTNFMSALDQTRVLPECLEDSYRRIKEEWSRKNT